MQFLFNGDVRRPAVIAVQATSQEEAVIILEAAIKRCNLEDARIDIYDEDSDQRLAAFDWDGEDGEELESGTTTLRLVSKGLRYA